DQVRLTVQGAAFYHRPVRLYAVETATDQSPIYRSIASWTVRSDAPNDYSVRGMHGKEYLLVIDNGDNPPLEVTSVEAAQLNRYLVAHLRAGTAYRLRFGDPEAPVPHYDLDHFRAAVADSIPQLLPGPVERVAQPPAAPDDPPAAWPPWALWTGIGLVIVILAYFSLNMLRHVSDEAPAEKEHDA
ncbi:MAG: hypothetical protein AAGB22_13675, partial [Bacteroidota bacterium]